jgi:hypothetical protein
LGGGWWWGPVVGPRRGTSRTLRWASSLGSTEAKVAKVALLRDRAPPGKNTGAQRGTATGNGPMATKCSGSGPPMEPPCLRWERPWTVSSRSSCLILFLSGPSSLYLRAMLLPLTAFPLCCASLGLGTRCCVNYSYQLVLIVPQITACVAPFSR